MRLVDVLEGQRKLERKPSSGCPNLPFLSSTPHSITLSPRISEPLAVLVLPRLVLFDPLVVAGLLVSAAHQAQPAVSPAD
jgi:hypothetical protein